MNERIEKLARQADACHIPGYDMWQMDTETLEKFAELIVQECVNVLHGNELWNRHVSHALNEHFGVEE